MNEKIYSGEYSPIDYTPLWETMKLKGVSQYRLIEEGINNKLLDTLRKKKNITVLTVYKLCSILKCTPNDIFRFPDIPVE